MCVCAQVCGRGWARDEIGLEKIQSFLNIIGSPIITVRKSRRLLGACARPLSCGFVRERHSRVVVENNASRPDHEAHECNGA